MNWKLKATTKKTGNTSQTINNKIITASQNNKTAPRKTIWTRRMTKLIRRLTISRWPYMGTKIFFTQMLKPRDCSRACQKSQSFLIALTSPTLYHHKGKYKISPKIPRIILPLDTKKLSLSMRNKIIKRFLDTL